MKLPWARLTVMTTSRVIICWPHTGQISLIYKCRKKRELHPCIMSPSRLNNSKGVHVSVKALKNPHYNIFSKLYTWFQTAKEQQQSNSLSLKDTSVSCQHRRFVGSFSFKCRFSTGWRKVKLLSFPGHGQATHVSLLQHWVSLNIRQS